MFLHLNKFKINPKQKNLEKFEKILEKSLKIRKFITFKIQLFFNQKRVFLLIKY